MSKKTIWFSKMTMVATMVAIRSAGEKPGFIPVCDVNGSKHNDSSAISCHGCSGDFPYSGMVRGCWRKDGAEGREWVWIGCIGVSLVACLIFQFLVWWMILCCILPTLVQCPAHGMSLVRKHEELVQLSAVTPASGAAPCSCCTCGRC